MNIIHTPSTGGGGGVTDTALANVINAATVDTNVADADQFPTTKTAASGALRRVTFATIRNWVLTFAASRLGYRTSNFTAEVGGRYNVFSGGTVIIADPTSPAPVAGDSYLIAVSGGLVRFGAGPQTYAASRFDIRRYFNGTAWITPAPTLSDTLNVGSGSWTGSTFNGDQNFASTNRPTSSATGTPASNSMITRNDADTRYGDFLISDLVADAAPIQSQTTLQNTGCEVTLGVGTWLVQAQIHVTNANTAAQMQFRGTLSGGTESFGSVFWLIANTGVPSQDNQSWFTGTRSIGNAARGWWRAEGLIRVTTGTVTVRTQYAQVVSTAADTIVRAGSHIIARRLKP